MIYHTPEGHCLRNGLNYALWKIPHGPQFFKLVFRLWRFKAGFWVKRPLYLKDKPFIHLRWFESAMALALYVTLNIKQTQVIFRIHFQSNYPQGF